VIVFVDTNVLLYAQDPRDAHKQKAAEQWLSWCWHGQKGGLSTQVVNELYANLRRIAPSLPLAEARAMVRRYRGWKCWTVDDATVDLAWLLQDRFTLSYWDGLMVAAAQQMGSTYLLTEDLQHEQQFDRLQVINPFKTSAAALGLA
jgi:predicted nucleic acid-binding protein